MGMKGKLGLDKTDVLVYTAGVRKRTVHEDWYAWRITLGYEAHCARAARATGASQAAVPGRGCEFVVGGADCVAGLHPLWHGDEYPAGAAEGEFYRGILLVNKRDGQVRQHLTASNLTPLREQRGQAKVYSITRGDARAKYGVHRALVMERPVRAGAADRPLLCWYSDGERRCGDEYRGGATSGAGAGGTALAEVAADSGSKGAAIAAPVIEW